MGNKKPVVLIKGGGELASGIAHKLFRSHFKVCLTEIQQPLAVRRGVSFSEAVFNGEKTVEGITAILVHRPDEIEKTWNDGMIPVIVDPEAKTRELLNPDVVIDAILAKRNTGTSKTDAELVIGLGPGFEAGKDVHIVIETNRGHNLGRVIERGKAESDTGIPGTIGGYSRERVVHAVRDGWFKTPHNIGDSIRAQEILGIIEEEEVISQIGGVVRGLIKDGAHVKKGMKIGDIDPRGIKTYCYSISDKSRTIAGGVLEAILAYYNK